MKHLHTLGIALGFKTAATCCGKRVKFSELALTEDADCQVCRKKAEEDHALAKRYVHLLRGENREVPHDLLAVLTQGPRYRNALSPLANYAR